MSEITLHNRSSLFLKETKVDKAYVQKELSSKVDNNAMNSKVEGDQFDVCVNEIDRNMQNILQKIEGTVSRRRSFTQSSRKD